MAGQGTPIPGLIPMFCLPAVPGKVAAAAAAHLDSQTCLSPCSAQTDVKWVPVTAWQWQAGLSLLSPQGRGLGASSQPQGCSGSTEGTALLQRLHNSLASTLQSEAWPQQRSFLDKENVCAKRLMWSCSTRGVSWKQQGTGWQQGTGASSQAAISVQHLSHSFPPMGLAVGPQSQRGSCAQMFPLLEYGTVC